MHIHCFCKLLQTGSFDEAFPWVSGLVGKVTRIAGIEVYQEMIFDKKDKPVLCAPKDR